MVGIVKGRQVCSVSKVMRRHNEGKGQEDMCAGMEGAFRETLTSLTKGPEPVASERRAKM